MLETIVHKKKPRQQPDSERYARLRARLLDEMGRVPPCAAWPANWNDYGLHFTFTLTMKLRRAFYTHWTKAF